MQPTTFPASRTLRPRLLAAALLGVTLAVALAVPAAAAPGDGGGLSPFAWLERAWTAIFGASGGDWGPDMDPNGVQAPAPGPGDFGPDMDPDGAQAPDPGDFGPDMDPNG